jgi:hypothetical protein
VWSVEPVTGRCLVRRDPHVWPPGWLVTPLLHCTALQLRLPSANSRPPPLPSTCTALHCAALHSTETTLTKWPYSSRQYQAGAIWRVVTLTSPAWGVPLGPTRVLLGPN